MKNELLLQLTQTLAHSMQTLTPVLVRALTLLLAEQLTLAAAWIFHHIAWLIGKPK